MQDRLRSTGGAGGPDHEGHVVGVGAGLARRRRSMPASVTSSAGLVSARTWSISTCGRRGLTGTYTPPASQMAAIVHTSSGPFGSITATAWPGSIAQLRHQLGAPGPGPRRRSSTRRWCGAAPRRRRRGDRAGGRTASRIGSYIRSRHELRAADRGDRAHRSGHRPWASRSGATTSPSCTPATTRCPRWPTCATSTATCSATTACATVLGDETFDVTLATYGRLPRIAERDARAAPAASSRWAACPSTRASSTRPSTSRPACRCRCGRTPRSPPRTTTARATASAAPSSCSSRPTPPPPTSATRTSTGPGSWRPGSGASCAASSTAARSSCCPTTG